MGLVVLILVGVVPAHFAFNPTSKAKTIHAISYASEQARVRIAKMAPDPITGQQAVDTLSDYLKTAGVANRQTFEALAGLNGDVYDRIAGKDSFQQLTIPEHTAFCSDIYLLSTSINKLLKPRKLEMHQMRSC